MRHPQVWFTVSLALLLCAGAAVGFEALREVVTRVIEGMQ